MQELDLHVADQSTGVVVARILSSGLGVGVGARCSVRTRARLSGWRLRRRLGRPGRGWLVCGVLKSRVKRHERVLQSLGIAAANRQDLLVEGVRGVGVRGSIQRGDQPRDCMLAFVWTVEFDQPSPGVQTHRGCGLPAAGERDHDAAAIFARLHRKPVAP